MKFDELGCLIREKYPEGHIANLGDSAAETCRAWILGDERGNIAQFIVRGTRGEVLGLLRHPLLKDVPGWGMSDFTGDQLIPLWGAWKLMTGENLTGPIWFIPGTWKLVTPAAWCMTREYFGAFAFWNGVQGLIMRNLKFRWSDEKHWFESDPTKVQDWANYLVIQKLFKELRVREALAKMRQYYSGPDAEPNSQFIVELYERSLRPNKLGPHIEIVEYYRPEVKYTIETATGGSGKA